MSTTMADSGDIAPKPSNKLTDSGVCDNGKTTKLPSTRLLSLDLDNSDAKTETSETDDFSPVSDSELEERLARYRELRAQLGSPESISTSVASGQFEDFDTESPSGTSRGSIGGRSSQDRATRSASSERLARYHRDLRAELGSPESIPWSVASGQFEDVDTESTSGTLTGSIRGISSQDRATRSTSSDRLSSVYSPLHDIAIPLPDASDVMQARFASLDNLRDSPIPLPDTSGVISPAPDNKTKFTIPTMIFDNSASKKSDGEGVWQKHQLEESMDRMRERSSASSKSTFTRGSTAAHEMSSKSSSESNEDSRNVTSQIDKTALGTVRLGGAYYSPVSTRDEPYTPGCYLANRDRYYGRGSTGAPPPATIVVEESYEQSVLRPREGNAGFPREIHPRDKIRIIIQPREDVLWDDHSIESYQQSRGKLGQSRESLGQTRESLGQSRERLGQSRERLGQSRESYTRDSLVKEVLAREANKGETPRESASAEPRVAESVEQQVPVSGLLDKGRLNSSRESLNTQYSLCDYSLRDYKNFVAKNYGRDEAERIRDRTPQRFTPGSTDIPSYQSYYVSEPQTPTVRVPVERDSEYNYRAPEWTRPSDSYSPMGPTQKTYVYEDRSRGHPIYTKAEYDHMPSHHRRRASDTTSHCSDSFSAYVPSRVYEEDMVPPEHDREHPGITQGMRSQSQPRRQERPAQKPYHRSYSGGSTRGTTTYQHEEKIEREQEKEREREVDEGRKRRSLFGRNTSMFDRDGIMDLLDDLFESDRKPDKRGLWARHSSLLRDDNFCRDFFTKEWDDWPSQGRLFDDDDFFSRGGEKPDGQKQRKGKVTRTEKKETREEGGNGNERIHRTSKTESMHSDMTSGREETSQDDIRGATSRDDIRERTAPDIRGKFTKIDEEEDRRFEEARASSGKNRGRRQDSEADRAFKESQRREEERVYKESQRREEEEIYKESQRREEEMAYKESQRRKEQRIYRESQGERGYRDSQRQEEALNRGDKRMTGETTNQGKTPTGRGRGDNRSDDDFFEKDTLYYRDFDDLINRFRDVKWKSAMESYKSKEEEKRREGEQPAPAKK